MAKTYAVHAVVDVKNKKRLTFREAIDENIFDPDAGSYLNTATGEKLYVGDAIRKGLIKVSFVTYSYILFCSGGGRVVRGLCIHVSLTSV